MQTYHNKTVQQTAELLGTDVKTGLTHDEVKKRLHHYGKNELIEKKKKNIFIKFLEQFNDFMIIILLSAAAVSFITSIMQGDADITEPVIILHSSYLHRLFINFGLLESIYFVFKSNPIGRCDFSIRSI